MIHRSFAAACLCALASCSVSQDQEVELGRENAAQINAQLPIVNDPVVATYIQDLGQSIASKTSRADLDWHFYVVNTNQVNAFALPGGYFYVNRGLVETAVDLDELTRTLENGLGDDFDPHAVDQTEYAQQNDVGIAVP